jgi:DNA polymerase-3 subunit beta
MTKIVFDTDVLAAALREVRGAVQRRNTIPILFNVLIEADVEGGVQLTTTDLDVVAMRRLQAAAVEASIAFTIDAHRLADVVGTFSAGSQTMLDHSPSAVIVSSGRARTRFSTLPKEDFPKIIQKDVVSRFTIDAKALNRGIDTVRHAISSEETRYYLNGILWHERNGRLVYAATDGHRLARYVDHLPDGAAGMPDTILRTRCVELARAAAEARNLPVEVSIGDDKVQMVAGDYTLLAKVIDGTFPDYTRVIPSTYNGTLSVDRDALNDAVTRVTVAVTDKVRVVKLEIEPELVRASVTSPEHGIAVDEVPSAFDAPPMEIGFNGRYLRDALSVLDVDTLEVRLTDGVSPAIITSPKAEDVTLVLMPMRV